MKNIFAILLLSAVTFSCTLDTVEDRPIIQAADAPLLLAPEAGNIYELSFETKDVQAERFVWSSANYEGNVEITYTLLIDANGGDFTNALTLGGSNSTNQISVSQETLNIIALQLGAQPFVASSFDVKLVSDISGLETMESNIVTITVIPYTTENPQLYVVGNFLNASGYGNDWTPGDAVPITASAFGETDFEGYVYLNVSSPEFKFLPTNSSFDGDYGDDGSYTGILVQEGESNCKAEVAGYYFVKANTTTLAYSLQVYNWGLIGSATPTGWDSDTNMVYDSTSKTWKLTIELIEGEIKFRANDSWDWNYGDDGADGSLENGSANVAITEAGNYTVVLDLSVPREYTYVLIKN